MQNQIFYKFFLTLNRRPFWKRSDSVHLMWYVTRVWGSEKGLLRPRGSNFTLAVQLVPSRKKNFHFSTSHHLETTKYEVRNKVLSVKRSKYRNAMDRVSVLRATGKLHAIRNSGLKGIIFSSWPLSSLLLIEIFFSQNLKEFNLTFCPVHITVTSNSSFTFRKCTRIILSLSFWTETSEQDKGRLLAVVTFCIFFSDAFRLKMRLLWGWLQLTFNSISRTFVCLSLTSNGSKK